MKFVTTKSIINGKIKIPGSKSHTIRALFFASMANGKSIIKDPLLSDDTLSALSTCEALGSKIEKNKGSLTIEGFAGTPKIPDNVIDVGNSGTTLRIALGTAALIDGYSIFTGDSQIRQRPIQPLLLSLNELGASAISAKENGKAPVILKGRAKGGKTKIDAVTSQYLTSLLINAPLYKNETEIEVTRLNETPYVDITLWWLDKLKISYKNNNYKTFSVKGSQQYPALNETIPGDFSSATFFAVLAAISGGKIELKNLDMSDPQGDKIIIKILEDMGTSVKETSDSIIIEGKNLKGREIDMNSIPDALPAMAVAACFAQGETRLINVPQARLKETDRISVMREELSKMGADIKELEDGLVIKESKLSSAMVSGHHDHRVAMALAVAGLNIKGNSTIDTAESATITFPNFADLIKSCNGKIKQID